VAEPRGDIRRCCGMACKDEYYKAVKVSHILFRILTAEARRRRGLFMMYCFWFTNQFKNNRRSGFSRELLASMLADLFAHKASTEQSRSAAPTTI
jgi:hypothetical protein